MALEINTDHHRRCGRQPIEGVSGPSSSAPTLNQAAIYLGLTADALKAKVHMDRIPTVDLDKKLRFDTLGLDRIIEESNKAV